MKYLSRGLQMPWQAYLDELSHEASRTHCAPALCDATCAGRERVGWLGGGHGMQILHAQMADGDASVG